MAWHDIGIKCKCKCKREKKTARTAKDKINGFDAKKLRVIDKVQSSIAHTPIISHVFHFLIFVGITTVRLTVAMPCILLISVPARSISRLMLFQFIRSHSALVKCYLSFSTLEKVFSSLLYSV